MTGNFIVNGIDAFATYGILITEKGYNSLVAYPALKPVDFNDWPEEDGIEVDLSNPVLDKKTVSIQFISVDESKLDGFFTEIKNTGYHTFNFTDIGMSFDLRLLSGSENKKIKSLEKFILKFSDDKPLNGYSYVGPSTGLNSDQGFNLDGANFNDYRVSVLQGSDNQIRKQAQLKENRIVESKYLSGIEYDTGIVKKKSKDVTLSLLLTTSNLSLFWRNYRAFLWDLIRVGPRILTTPIGVFNCYYQSSTISKFLITDAVWCEFKVKLKFI